MADPAAVAAGRGASTVAARKKPKPLRVLAYLPHSTGSAAAPKDLGVLDAGITADRALQTAFEEAVDDLQAREVFWKEDKRRGTKKQLVDLRAVPVALLDLTADRFKPKLAGFHLTEARYPASVGKVGCMLGAHQLRFDLEVLKARSGVKTQKELFALAREAWGKTQTAASGAVAVPLFPGKKGKQPKLELVDKLVHFDGRPASGGKYAAPNLERIFAPDDTTMTAWRSTGEAFPDLDKFEYPKDFPGYEAKKLSLDKLGFKERMDLMVGWSHNGASASCIRDVGFLYINSALLQSGIYAPDQGGGLWVGSSYGGDSFRSDPVASQSIGATPLSLARMFALLAQDRLIGKAACDGMRRLTHKTDFVDWDDASRSMATAPGLGSRSFFGEVFTNRREKHLGEGKPDPFERLEVWSKLGIYKGNSDVACIEVKPTGKKLYRFVLAGLKASADLPVLQALALAAEIAVKKTN